VTKLGDRDEREAELAGLVADLEAVGAASSAGSR
jgi:hypothetical protein